MSIKKVDLSAWIVHIVSPVKYSVSFFSYRLGYFNVSIFSSAPPLNLLSPNLIFAQAHNMQQVFPFFFKIPHFLYLSPPKSIACALLPMCR